MPSKNPAQRLRDIIDNIDAIAAFTAQFDFPSFRMDRKTVTPWFAPWRLSRRRRDGFPASC
jgi:uncharacterized protein with HEPN domain